MACTVAEPGTTVSFAYASEVNCGTSPTLTSVANVAASSVGGVSKFTRASGSWITDGFVGFMSWVLTAGFTTSGNNGYFRVIAVTATDLTVDDPSALLVTEVAGAGKTAIMVYSYFRSTTPRQLLLDREELESQEVRPSRAKAQSRQGFSSASGNFGFELALRAQTEWITMIQGGVWTKPAISGDPDYAMAAATPSVGKARITRATGSFITEGFRPGDVITTTLFTDANNNRQWRILALTATTLDLGDPTSAAVTAASSAPPVITYPGYRIDLGLNIYTNTLERRFATTSQYDVWRGFTVNELQLTLNPKEIVSGTVSLIGLTGSVMTGTSIATSGVAAPSQTAPMTLFTGEIYEGGTRQALLTSMDVTISNNRTTEAVIGSATSPAIFEGSQGVSGSMTFFMADGIINNKFWNETNSSLFLKMQDPTSATDFISLSIPSLKYMSADIDPPQMGPVPISMNFVANPSTQNNPGGTTIETNVTFQISAP